MAMSRTVRQQGIALPLVLMVSTLVLLLGVTMIRYTTSDLTFATAQRSKTRAFYAAEMGLARGLDKIRTDFYGGRLVSLQPSITYQGTAADGTGNSPYQKKLPDETFGSQGSTNYYEHMVTTADGSYRVRYQIIDAPWTQALPNASRSFTVEAVARDTVRDNWAGLRTSFNVDRTMLYFYGVFFKDDLEILPGPSMTFAGPVHTNRNMYLGSGGTLTFDSDLTSAGHIYKGRKDNTTVSGTVRIRNTAGAYTNMDSNNDSIDTLPGWNPYDLGDATKGDGQPTPADTWRLNTNWKQGALDTWNGRVRDVTHGVTEQTPPPIESIERGGYYETNAGLKIITNAAGTTTIYKADGTPVNPTSLGANNPISTSQFYNSREQMTVKVTNVDVGKLQASGLYPTNGTIYASREDAIADATPTNTTPDVTRRPYGIRLTNAATLPDATTFVSNNPVYVKGDFNKHITGGTDTWKPSAILSDSMSIQSNSWNDTSNATANGQVASNTVVNSIVITGNRNSNTTEGYSGGLENFPRFLENWSGKTLTFRGSMIQLWQSKFGTGKWSNTSYSPPTRDWGYDMAFGVTAIPPGFANLFPSTTRGISQGKWTPLQPGSALLTI